MKKIPTIFERDFSGNPSLVLSEPNRLCQWVFDGEGAATRKYDGTSCMFDGNNWWKRREVKSGKHTPDDFLEMTHDKITGKRTGWVPVVGADKWHLEGIKNSNVIQSGTFELCGPKLQGNPEGFDMHVMVSHDSAEVLDAPRSFEGLRDWLSGKSIEGIVFHHPDGRMAKIKRRDFGLDWPIISDQRT